MDKIILTTLNARYIHSALGLRYLFANMEDLQQITEIREFTIDTRPIDVAESLLKMNPSIIGFGVYIWNVEQTRQVVAIIKTAAPDVIIVLGGPEVGFESDQHEIARISDYVIAGAADHSFRELCAAIIFRQEDKQPFPRFIPSTPPVLSTIRLPYDFYTDEDLANRVIYVEASRGCPFKCEFCLSSLDKTAWQFDTSAFLSELEKLHARGARSFKFVDRTFNLKQDTTSRILQFFLELTAQYPDEELFLHFELIPDHLPEKLKQLIIQFPTGSLQFEIGIQTFNPEVQTSIQRKQNNNKSLSNIEWLRNKTHAHLHTDLIIGLPGEDMESFARGFDQLVSLKPHEIQVGILKRLRGTPIARHTTAFGMVYNPAPPYNILKNNHIDFFTMQRLTRFARYWDMIANSGRFGDTLPVVLGNSPFANFMTLSDWLFNETRQTHRIALPRLFNLLFRCLVEKLNIGVENVTRTLLKDFSRSGLKGQPSFAKVEVETPVNISAEKERDSNLTTGANKRQSRHSSQLH